MDKYSPEQLKQLAMNFLFLDGAADPRADYTLYWISHFTGLNSNQIREKIRELAK